MNGQRFMKRLEEEGKKSLSVWDAPSVGLGIIKDGEIVFSGGFGERDKEKHLPADADTLYQIGSCTKAFTAALAAIFVDQGKLDFDTPIREYIPELRFYDEYTTENCTLRDVLYHRTGIPRHEYSWYGTDFDRHELIHNLRYLEPNRPFRTVFQYNNYGYLVAGEALERVSGKTYEQLLQEYLFDPLGMNRTSCYVDSIGEDENHAVPYDRPDGTGHKGCVPIPFYRTSVENRSKGIGAPFAAAGSINSSVSDMLKWVQLHLSRGEYNGRRILSEKSCEELHTPAIFCPPLDISCDEMKFSSYAMGWKVESYRGTEVISHGGNINGFSGYTGFIPSLGLGVVAYTNMNSSFGGYALAKTVYDHYLGFDGEDWQNRYFCFVTERSGAFEEYLSGLRGPQVPGTHPSHELKDYEGTYARDGYGDCVIREENGTLIMHFLSADCRLEHYHYDTFISKNIVGEIPPGLPVVFQISPQGEVIGVSMALVTEDGKYITFRKK